MQNSPISSYQCYPQQGPNAVSINIYSPQAYGNGATSLASAPSGGANNSNCYSMYGPNSNPNLPLYPQNYNNMINSQPNPQMQMPNNQPNMINPNVPIQSPTNQTNGLNETNSSKKTVTDETNKNSQNEEVSKKDDDKKKKEKTITPLTDEYVKSLENYLNDANPKVRLIAAKELLERFKEDDNRKDNPSLMPLVNKILQDTSPAVRFLGLTMLNLDYCTGDNQTVDLLKQIQSQNTDKIGEEQLLASEILLRMSAPDKIKVQEEATE